MNENKDKTCKKCAHRIMSDRGYPIYYCNITGKKARGNDSSCEHFENTEQEDKNERLRKIATRLEQLEKEYAEKKIDLESFIRQRSILIGKKEGLESPKGKKKLFIHQNARNMKKQTILRGFHRPLALLPAFMREKLHDLSDMKWMSKDVIFNESCRYIIGLKDQFDWNKLFGWCYGIFGIHRNSVRVVWRYDDESEMIEVGLYMYVDGFRYYPLRTLKLEIGKKYHMTLENNCDKVTFKVDGYPAEEILVAFPTEKRTYACGLYFGGNRRAPHTMTISMDDELSF